MRMDFNEASRTIRASWQDILSSITTKAKDNVNGKTSWICPICGHGKNGDGLTFNPQSRDGNGLHCFGCNFTGDIVDLYSKLYHYDTSQAFKELARSLSIEIDGKEGALSERSGSRAVFKRGEAYLNGCASLLDDSKEAQDYLAMRGISLETARAFHIGYDPNWQSPTALERHSNPKPSKRLIIPNSGSNYVARAIEETEKKYQKMNEGTAGLSNEAALYGEEGEAVFVVEGIFDAMSIAEAGFQAVALNSTSNTRLLIELLEKRPTAKTILVALDNDEAGRRASRDLAKELERIGATFLTARPYGNSKDANEALQENREEFTRQIELAVQKTSSTPYLVNGYLDTLLQQDLENFKAGCSGSTGFSNIDEMAGGLFQGLYVIGAVSSLGKTTFALQIADNQAKAGRDVLYFSLEQSRLELVTKSLARMYADKHPGSKLSSLSLRRGNYWKTREIAEILEDYRENIGCRMSIMEANFNCSVDTIRETVRNHIERTGNIPVVFVDYLQILQPAESKYRQTTKEVVDDTITQLKRLSREYGLTIFVISSFNRSNYLTQVDFESFKESGAIEYGSDVVWGLQLMALQTNEVFHKKDASIDEKREAIRIAKAENPRRIELVCLKNRFGISNYSCRFEYFPAQDRFQVDSRAKRTAVTFQNYKEV